MVAMVDRVIAMRLERIDRVEIDYVHARPLEPIEEGGGRVARPIAVINHIDGDPRSSLGDEQIAEFDAIVCDVLEDEILEVDVIPGGLDSSEHGAEGVGAIAQDAGAVAGDQRTLGDRLFDREMALERAGIAGLSAQSVEQRLALRR